MRASCEIKGVNAGAIPKRDRQIKKSKALSPKGEGSHGRRKFGVRCSATDKQQTEHATEKAQKKERAGPQIGPDRRGHKSQSRAFGRGNP